MGLFDSIRNAVGGSADDAGDDASSLRDSTTLDPTDFRTRAESVADADGLDFSRGSLAHLDSHVASLSDPETADDAAAPTTYADPALRYGSYLGEVLVRAYDGAWTRDEGWGVTVAGPDDEVTVAVFDIAARSLDGDPVFAAIVERLEAELALGADANADGLSTAPEPEAGPEEGASDPAAAPKSGAQTATEDDATSGDGAAPDVSAGASIPDASPAADDTAAGSSDGGDTTADGVAADDATVAAAGETAGDVTAEADTEPVTPDPETDQQSDEPATAFIAEAEAESEAAGAGDDVAVETPDASDTSAPSGGGIDLGSDAPAAEPAGPADAPDADPTAGDGLRAEYADTAQEFAAFWSEHDLDFDPDSLSRLDALVDGEWDAGRFRDATFGAEADFDDRAFTSLVTELGSYFGEVLVRTVDGEWTEATDHGAAVVVATDTDPLAVPVFTVAENSLRQTAVFERSYEALLEDIGRGDVA
ncbi:hypothetical protein ACFQGE_07750 [Halomicroarcula sp. GCM10025817]|uniref:hypothetical protein n=1 Tax=Haloarcula TaxID=2237 RepID=UPI0023E8D92A|nr:hypothetical protein [Halomicroarcula sp. SYNS111]